MHCMKLIELTQYMTNIGFRFVTPTEPSKMSKPVDQMTPDVADMQYVADMQRQLTDTQTLLIDTQTQLAGIGPCKTHLLDRGLSLPL